MIKRLTKAIIPVAGFGTRMLPATKTIPKEMLPVFDTPVIDWIIREVVQAGIQDIILVTSSNKKSIEDYFDVHFELETKLKSRSKTKLLRRIEDLHNLARIMYVRQTEPLGGGHAILCAHRFLAPDESAIVLFGDDIVMNEGGKNAVEQMLDMYMKDGNPVVLLQDVAKEDVSKYGIVQQSKNGLITDIVEKPSIETAPSSLAVVGKYILTPRMFEFLYKTKSGLGGEIGLTDAFYDYIRAGESLRGCVLEGKRFDTGDPIGYAEAFLYAALLQYPDEIKKRFRSYL